MPAGTIRPLNLAERAALSPGLWTALEQAGARPTIVARAAIGARIASLWRGDTPVLTLGSRIYWPGAVEDFTLAGRNMSVLQHELQHVLEYATGELGLVRYAINPRNWVYDYKPADAPWKTFGAEQRAQIVQDLWLLERNLITAAAPKAWYRAIIPWTTALD